MTLSELLEGLKVADPETYEEISHLEFVGWHQPRNQALDHLQGCIQRACERRGWEIEQNYRTQGRDGNLPKNMRHYAVVTSWDNDVHTYRGMGGTSASALLAAYIAAVRGGGEAMSAPWPEACSELRPDSARRGGAVTDTTCQLRFIARALSGGILDDRCQQEGCAMWSGARKCCGLIKEADQ